MLKYSFCILLIALICQKSNAQPATSDTSSSIAINPVIVYYDALGEQSPLYNGSEYLNYANTIRLGHPFFGTTEFFPGTIHFEGMVFQNVMLLYDIVKDKVIVRHYDKVHKIDLPVKKIEQFTFVDHHFIRLLPDSARVIEEGFYDRIYHGKTTLLVKRRKKIREERAGNEIYNVVDEADFFYIQKQGRYHPAKNMRVLLKILSDKKEQIQKHLRKNGIKFKTEPEKAMIMAVEYYDALST